MTTKTSLTSSLFSSFRRPFVFLLPLALAACAVPGMHMGYRAADNSNPGGAASSDVTARADVYAVNPTLIARMTQEEQTVQAGLRNTAAGKLPRSGDDGYRYLIGPQDILRITVYNHPELTNPAGTANELAGRVVNSDGTFFFPFIGKIKAAGRTVEEVRDELASKLGPFIKSPQVEVSVLTYRSQRVYVAGEVLRPSMITMSDVPIRVTDAIAQAGGPLAGADLGSVTLTRANQTYNVDLYGLYYRGDVAQNVLLQGGDVINVGEQRFNKVFVLGEVGRPNSLVMPRGRMTLAEALADSGGVNPFSAHSGQVFVIRDQPNSTKPAIYHLNASAPDALVLADKFNLRARDVVFVDAVPVVRWARVVNNILPTIDVLRPAINDISRGLPR
jgi:polysaccharide export outer membrane protein